MIAPFSTTHSKTWSHMKESNSTWSTKSWSPWSSRASAYKTQTAISKTTLKTTKPKRSPWRNTSRACGRATYSAWLINQHYRQTSKARWPRRHSLLCRNIQPRRSNSCKGYGTWTPSKAISAWSSGLIISSRAPFSAPRTLKSGRPIASTPFDRTAWSNVSISSFYDLITIYSFI